MPEQVRRGECTNCGEIHLIQHGWLRAGVTAVEREMCRRCWRLFMRQRMIVTPQTAGKINARRRRAREGAREALFRQPVWEYEYASASTATPLSCRHGVPEGGLCERCELMQRRAAEARQRILDAMAPSGGWSFESLDGEPVEQEEDEVEF